MVLDDASASLSRLKQGFDSRKERQENQLVSQRSEAGVGPMLHAPSCPKFEPILALS